MLKNNLYILLILLFVASCKQEKTVRLSFISPEAGTRIKSGNKFTIDIDFTSVNKIDSVVYYVDSTLITSKKDTGIVKATTHSLALGNHLITAKVYQGKDVEELTSNITILAAKAPVQLTYKVINTFPHDPSAYTQGLKFYNGFLYESTGINGESSLRKVDLNSGKTLKLAKLPANYFAEGIAIIGNKIFQITYTEKMAFEYDLATLEKIREFPFSVGNEGWGLDFDGEKILNSDGTNTIYFLDKNTYQKIGSLDVYDDEGPVALLNELEVINGKIYANIYDTEGKYSNKIVVIDPKTGAVESAINMQGLNPETTHPNDPDYILNGIAWDEKGKRLFVTGKKWSKLFEIAVK